MPNRRHAISSAIASCEHVNACGRVDMRVSSCKKQDDHQLQTLF
jgi:hypothetical protein